jgi:hypothetical protein
MKTVIKYLKIANNVLDIVRKDTAGLSGFQSKLRELIFEAEQLKTKENGNN